MPHNAFAPADREHDERHDGDGREREVEQKLIGLFTRGGAIVARDLDVDVIRQRRAAKLLQPLDEVRRDIDGVRPCPLGDGDRDCWRTCQFAILVLGELPALLLQRLAAHDDLRNVTDIDRVALPCGQKKKPNVGNALQRLPRNDRHSLALVAIWPARKERFADRTLSTSCARVTP